MPLNNALTAPTAVDVAVIGGGVIGSAIAYFLMASGDFDGNVAVIERDSTYARASTPLSVGGVRQQFSIRENVEIGLYARQFIANIAETLAVDGEIPDIAWREGGYLFLASEAGRDTLAANHAVQTGAGADISWLEAAEIAARFPWINPDGLAAGCFGESGEGWVDPNALMQAFRRKARSLGAIYLDGEVTGFTRAGASNTGASNTGASVTGVELADGRTLTAGTTVIAAGANSGAVGRLAGIEIPVEPRKRSAFMIDCRSPEAPPRAGPGRRPAPLTIDPSGVYCRPEGSGYICGVSPPAEADAPTWDQEVDWYLFEEVVWPALAERIPAFEAVKTTGAWAGWYDYNTLDQNALIGPAPGVNGLLVATGFSGHGLQQAPAIGRAVMELVTAGEYRSLDLTRFGLDRVARGEAVKELGVV